MHREPAIRGLAEHRLLSKNHTESVSVVSVGLPHHQAVSSLVAAVLAKGQHIRIVFEQVSPRFELLANIELGVVLENLGAIFVEGFCNNF
jgi:hypothetical protein